MTMMIFDQTDDILMKKKFNGISLKKNIEKINTGIKQKKKMP